MGIARRNDTVVSEQYDGKRATDLAECVDDARQKRIGSRVSNQMDDDFAIGRGLKDRAIGFEFIAQHLRIDQIAVVSEREITEGEID